jgi:biopolymer transport protein ExbD
MAGQPMGDSGGDDLINAINITPLVDIFLVLLIIFMVTATVTIEEQARRNEIPLTLPKAHSGNPPDKEATPLNVILDRAGRVYLNGQASDLSSLGEVITARTAKGGPPDVVLSADRNLTYGQVTRVIDYIQLRGIGSLAINVEEQDIVVDQGSDGGGSGG